MPRSVCIWGKLEGQEKYNQLIADGWTPMMEGEITVVLVKEEKSCNSASEVHTDTEQ